MRLVALETSSYLPLIWRTPYSASLMAMMTERASDTQFVLQRDCVREAAGYLSFADDWRYNPAMRFRRMVEKLSAEQLQAFSYPSTAVQLLMGGNIWPQAQYLNFVRHTTFFFIDLLDDLAFTDPAEDLLRGAERIEQRTTLFRTMFEQHAASDRVRLPTSDMLSYWGGWYLDAPEPSFEIVMLDDPRPYHFNADKLRDLYHYECVLDREPPVAEMIVANTGFTRNVKASIGSLPVPIACARTMSAEFFSA